MYCISEESLSKLSFRGNIEKGEAKFLYFALDQCKNSTTNTDCKPKEEIESFMNGLFIIFLGKTQKYNPDEYGDNQIENVWLYRELTFDATEKVQGILSIQK